MDALKTFLLLSKLTHIIYYSYSKYNYMCQFGNCLFFGNFYVKCITKSKNSDYLKKNNWDKWQKTKLYEVIHNV